MTALTRTAVVLTFPRSGSSLLAGMIHRLGVPMGAEDELGLGRHLNRHGCHEDQEMQRISLNLLFEAGLLLDLGRRLAIDEQRLERVARRFDRPMAAFVRRHQGATWGFKDPSLIYGLPYLHHHLENPRYVVLTRSPEATARSLYRTFRSNTWLPELREKLPLFSLRNKLMLLPRAAFLRLRRGAEYHDLRFFQRVVGAGHARINDFIVDREYLCFTLETLVTEPQRAVERLVGFLKLSPSRESVRRAVAFVQPELLTADRSASIPG